MTLEDAIKILNNILSKAKVQYHLLTVKQFKNKWWDPTQVFLYFEIFC